MNSSSTNPLNSRGTRRPPSTSLDQTTLLSPAQHGPQTESPGAAKRRDFEQRVDRFAQVVKEYGPKAAQLEWMHLLHEASEVGTAHDLRQVLHLAASLPETVDDQLLIFAIEHMPRIHGLGAREAAGQLLKQCLLWAAPFKQSVWPKLLACLKDACHNLPKQAETEIQDMFLSLLGVDALRVFMARPGRLMGERVESMQIVQAGVHGSTDSLFMALPKELRMAIFQWIIPEPSEEHYAQSVQQHAAKLMTICAPIQREVAPLLVESARVRRGHWTCADRMPGTPSQAIEALRLRFLDRLATAKGSASYIYVHVLTTALKAEVRALKQLFHVIARLPDVQQRLDAFAEVVAVLFTICGRDVSLGSLDVVPAIVTSMCLALDGEESEEGFRELLDTMVRDDRWTPLTVVGQEVLSQIGVPLSIYAPATYHSLLSGARGLLIKLLEGNSALEMIGASSPDPESILDTLLYLSRNALQDVSSVSWLYLVSKAHPILMAPDSPIDSDEWSRFANKAVGAFLEELNQNWPFDAPLPAHTLLGRVPLDLLRRAFQALGPEVREALLQRPLTFDEAGVCQQLPLLCDFLLDENIPIQKRMDCLNSWVQLAPELRKQLQAVAWEWQVSPE